MPRALSPLHLLLAIAVMAVWGTNFVVIKAALEHLPSLLLAALRFTFVFLPLAFFLKKPNLPWRTLAAYGLLIGAGQFGVLFVAMKHDISPGLASLVIQTQVFFTIGLAMTVNRERVMSYQWAALALAALGLGVIIFKTDASATPLGIALTLLAAANWAGGNIVARSAKIDNMLAFIVWSGLFAAPPLFIASLIFEGWPAIEHGVVAADAGTWAAVLWQSVGNTMFGYGVWGWLLSRYPAALVTPWALLVPIFGMGAALVWDHEAMPAWKLIAAGLVMSGLAINVLGPRLRLTKIAAP